VKETRRVFLKQAASACGGIALAGYAANFGLPAVLAAGRSEATAKWSKQVGLELFTVRDMMTDQKGYISTLEQVAAIGYKEIEPAEGYAGLEPKDFRALLDRLGLSMPSTHSGASGATQAELEKRLAEFQVMGIKYTGANIGAGSGGAGGGRGGARGAGAATGTGRGVGAAVAPPQSVESVKQQAAHLNEMGKIVQKFGMKILVHNHTQEFALLDDGESRQHDVIVQNTDPALVAMQLDIGWASVAGMDVLGLFKKYSGRYELWHVKDATGIKGISPTTTGERPDNYRLAPVGLGEVDYATIFANAELAGMKHFAVEQDNAASWGDSIAAARVSYDNLVKILS
jgi:sugar phosphate isomerase/epimerase